MYQINRTAVILKPKQPFVDWANQLPDTLDLEVSLDQLREECTTFLIPDYPFTEQTREFIYKNHCYFFEYELRDWCEEKAFWPKKRDLQTFIEWCDIEINSLVIDMMDDAIEKEEL